MLKDFFINRDAINFLTNFIRFKGLSLPKYESALVAYGQQQRMSYEQWWSLLDELDTTLAIPALGLEIGRCVKVEHCGVLGYLFRTSQNLATALACYQRFERLMYAGGKVSTELKGKQSLSLIWDPQHGYSSQLSDALLLSSMTNVIREVLSPAAFNPINIAFTQSIPDKEIGLYETFFGCPVSQQQQQLSMTFNFDDLERPIPEQDQTLHQLLDQQAQEKLQRVPEDDLFMADLRDTLERCLHEGKPQASYLAQQVRVSERTLHRRLKAKQCLYRELLKDVRQALAIRYLTDEQLTLTEVSLLLGYSEQSAFSRAFSSWFGNTPSEFRRRSKMS